MLENGMVLEMDKHLNDMAAQQLPICPECGEECEIIYIYDGELMGCEYCYENLIVKVDAWEYEASQRR